MTVNIFYNCIGWWVLGMQGFECGVIFSIIFCPLTCNYKGDFSVPQIVEKIRPHKKVWLGETSSAFGGGAPSLSNTFAAGFMWVSLHLSQTRTLRNKQITQNGPGKCGQKWEEETRAGSLSLHYHSFLHSQGCHIMTFSLQACTQW